jgi:hypothetical protein
VVERGLRVGAQRLGRYAVVRKHRDSRFQRHAQLDAVDQHRLRERFAHARKQAVDHVGRLVAGGHRDGEMIRPDARHGVLVACRRAQPHRHLAQQVVARAPAKALVHHPEALEVEKHRRGEAPLAPRRDERLPEAIDEQAAVRQIGERIVIREVIHARLLRHVVQRESDVAGKLVQQAHLLIVEHVLVPRIEEQRSGRASRDDERQHRVGMKPPPQRRLASRRMLRGLEVVAHFLGRRNRKLLDAQVLAALAARHHALLVEEADRGEAETAALDGDAARLRQQVVALGHAHDERIDGR